MQKIKSLILIVIFGIGLASCSITYKLPSMTTENEMGEKKGEASYTLFLGIGFDRDRSVAEAAKNGNITKISTVDYKIETGFLTTTYSTVVTGK